ncbi:MAG: c-type cytochrome domain-containing protein [Candidatus Hydrogenedentota bacterium]
MFLVTRMIDEKSWHICARFRLRMLIAWTSVVLGLTVNAFGQEVEFGRDVWPIIENRCIECHGPEEQEEGLRFDDLEWLSDDELLGDGDASKSLIYELVTLRDEEDGYMPRMRERLTAERLEVLKRWLNEGANSDGWVVPDVIVVERTGYITSKGDRLALLAKGVSPAPEEALSALRNLGAVAVPLAENNNLVRVSFDLIGSKIEDADLELLAPLSKHVTFLGLANTNVTNAGLANLTTLPKLTQLHLGNTQIGDEGIQHISDLKNLETLNLFNTKVTDAGLDWLTNLGNLRRLYAWQSQITLGGANALIESIPGLKVDLGFELSESVSGDDVANDVP